jgi:Protein of unknown function (DUF1360)
MEPISETPTDPSDYAALTLTYGSLLAALAYSQRHRSPVEHGELVPLATATFALSKLVGKEKVESWVRAPFVEETPEGKRPKGQGMRYAVGELLSCTRCLGAWSALGLVGLRLASPEVSRTVTTVLTASACNDFLQTGFSWLTARTNSEQAKSEG